MDKILNFLVVGLGGAVGSMLRYAVTLLGTWLNGVAFNGSTHNMGGIAATFAVNIAGSFLIGLLGGYCKDQTMLLLLTVGLCGGFTTFSTFSQQNVRMLQEGRVGSALFYSIVTVVVCILAAWFGSRLAPAK